MNKINFLVFILSTMSNLSFGQEGFMTEGTANWTSCEEFLYNTTFDHHNIIDVDWKIFYFWSYSKENSYHVRFNPAAPILVDRFKVELLNVDPTIDWTRAVMFMETSIDFSGLYFETDSPGMYRLIPSDVFNAESVPVLMFGLKLVDGYLGIENCKLRLCYALASVDKLPEDDELYTAAEKLGFYGSHNRSYLAQLDSRPPLSPYLEDDSDDDEQVEIDNDVYSEL